ncbi:MAG TPA: SgcJ/EcaC family oxidoreductase, partial [Patescibacteria group bacterium]|nr:SgcJ/EcaC family oxidoreductase [Patescibacteria group bacterium]
IQPKEPIGAVVKKADVFFTNIVRRTKQHGTFNRIEWQFLNLMKEKQTATLPEVMSFLSIFDTKYMIKKLIERFRHDSLITVDQEEITISHKGVQVFEEVHVIQEEIKKKALDGITEAQYDIAVEVLYKIMDNLKDYLPEETEVQLSNEDSAGLDTIKSADEQAEDIQLIRQIIAKMEEAHNQKDPELLANLFADNAVFVNAVGARLQGRDAIYKSTMRVMKTFLAKSYARYEIAGIRFIKKDVAIAEINQRPISAEGDFLKGETQGIPTYILTKNAELGEWKIVAGQNTLVVAE